MGLVFRRIHLLLHHSAKPPRMAYKFSLFLAKLQRKISFRITTCYFLLLSACTRALSNASGTVGADASISIASASSSLRDIEA